jgi:mannose-6-phosphate isomerase-like protein (cupin superfamily)
MDGEMTKINVAAKLDSFSDHWSPKVIGRVNDTEIKLAKLQGEFMWHHHEAEDELFLVVKGRLLLQFRDREEWIEEGELIIVPRGVEHRPVAHEEVHVLFVEPAGTLNTGNVRNERTVDTLDRI